MRQVHASRMESTNNAAALAERLIEARKQANLSQGKLAARIGISSSTIWRWEHQLSWPDTEPLQRAAEVMGVSVQWLLTGRDGAGEPAPDGWVAYIRSPEGQMLTDEERDFLRSIDWARIGLTPSPELYTAIMAWVRTMPRAS